MRLQRQCFLLLLAAVLLFALAAQAANDTRQGPEYLALGHYPQEESGAQAPILWRVLARDGNKALLLSEYVLDAQSAHSGEKYGGFEPSTLAAWLNGDFLNAAFTPQEQSFLLAQENGLKVSLPAAGDLRNEAYGFLRDKDRAARPTAHALAQGAEEYRDGSASYWIKDPSESMDTAQRRVIEGGSLGYTRATADHIGVRPLIVIQLDPGQPAIGKGSLEKPFMLSGSAEPTPVPTPGPTPTPPPAWGEFGQTRIEGFPALDGEGFLPAGEKEFVEINEEQGLWRYAGQDLRLVIEKSKNEALHSNVLVANIFLREGAQGFRMAPHTEGKWDENRSLYKGKPVDIMRSHKMVFSMDGDYFLYRVGRSVRAKGYAIGAVIREGSLIIDKPASESRNAYPPLDYLGLYPGGYMKVFDATEITAEELLRDGAQDVLSFGPVLIRDGQLGTFHPILGNTPQPRAAIGMVEPGHYVAVIIEGRINGSKGSSVTQLADFMQELGCTLAFNLDGGWTSAMVFMGKQLNQLDNSGVRNNAREQNEVMGIGYTEAYAEGRLP